MDSAGDGCQLTLRFSFQPRLTPGVRGSCHTAILYGCMCLRQPSILIGPTIASLLWRYTICFRPENSGAHSVRRKQPRSRSWSQGRGCIFVTSALHLRAGSWQVILAMARRLWKSHPLSGEGGGHVPGTCSGAGMTGAFSLPWCLGKRPRPLRGGLLVGRVHQRQAQHEEPWRTPIGRATVLRLGLNSAAQVAARRQWTRLGLFP